MEMKRGKERRRKNPLTESQWMNHIEACDGIRCRARGRETY